MTSEPGVTNRPKISFEFFPPATPAGASALEESARQLSEFDPLFVSVTYGAGGSNRDRTFDAVTNVARSCRQVAGHLTCVAASRQAVNEVIDTYRSQGVSHVVALRGDPPADAPADCPGGVHPEGFATAADLVAGIRDRADGGEIEISVGAYPECHPKAASPQADLDNLKQKIDAGADRAITQMFFDTDLYFRFVDRARAAGVTASIVPGIMPIANFDGICNFASRIGTSIPTSLAERFAAAGDDRDAALAVATEVASEQCQQLLDGGVDHLHLYTMNKPGLSSAVCRNLGIEPATVGASAGATNR